MSSKEGFLILFIVAASRPPIKVIVTYAIANDYRSLMMFNALINNLEFDFFGLVNVNDRSECSKVNF